MKCPECGMAFGVQERICRRCRFCPELGRAVEMDPPRAGRWGRHEVIGRTAREKLSRIPASNANADYKLGRMLLIMLMGVLPGLGHAIMKRWRLAALFATLVWSGVIFASTTSNPTAGQLILGLSLSVHTMSIMTLVPKDWELTTMSRLAATMGVMFALGGTLYMPWSRTLMADWGQYEMVNAARVTQRTWIMNFYSSMTALLIFVGVAAFSYLVSLAVSHHIQKRRNRAQ